MLSFAGMASSKSQVIVEENNFHQLKSETLTQFKLSEVGKNRSDIDSGITVVTIYLYCFGWVMCVYLLSLFADAGSSVSTMSEEGNIDSGMNTERSGSFYFIIFLFYCKLAFLVVFLNSSRFLVGVAGSPPKLSIGRNNDSGMDTDPSGIIFYGMNFMAVFVFVFYV